MLDFNMILNIVFQCSWISENEHLVSKSIDKRQSVSKNTRIPGVRKPLTCNNQIIRVSYILLQTKCHIPKGN